MLSKLVNPHVLLPCPFAWNNVCLWNDVPSAFLGCCGRWGSFECYAWVQAISVDGVWRPKRWTVVGAVGSVHPFVEDINSTARSRGKELLLVDVWIGVGIGIGIGIGGVVCSVFLRNLTASPSSPSSPSSPLPCPFPQPQGCIDNSLGSVVFVGFWAGQVSISGGGAGRGTGGATALNDCAGGIAGGGAAVEDGGTGMGVDAGVDTASVNDAMMAVATKLLHGDVVKWVCWVAVATGASSEDGADASPTDRVVGVVDAAFNKPPERNVSNMNDGLAVESDERGWVLACVTVQVVIGEWAAGFWIVGNVGATTESFNKFGSMWPSLIAVGDGKIGQGGELVFSSPNAPSGELRGSMSNGLSRAWRWNAQEIGSEGPLSSCKWKSGIGVRGRMSRASWKGFSSAIVPTGVRWDVAHGGGSETGVFEYRGQGGGHVRIFCTLDRGIRWCDCWAEL